jgi:hypothetical protein
VTDEAGDDAEKKVEVTAILTAPATPPTEACLPLRIEEDKPTRPDLLRSRAVLRKERRGHVKERRGARQDAVHAVAADGRCQPGLLLYLRGPPPISPWSSVEAKSSTAQAKVAWHRGGPSPLPSIPVAAFVKTNRSRVCYLSREREIARVRSLSVVAGARRGQIDLRAIFDRAFGPFVR